STPKCGSNISGECTSSYPSLASPRIFGSSSNCTNSSPPFPCTSTFGPFSYTATLNLFFCAKKIVHSFGANLKPSSSSKARSFTTCSCVSACVKEFHVHRSTLMVQCSNHLLNGKLDVRCWTLDVCFQIVTSPEDVRTFRR